MVRFLREDPLEILPRTAILPEAAPQKAAVVSGNGEVGIDEQNVIELEGKHLEIRTRKLRANPRGRRKEAKVVGRPFQCELAERLGRSGLLSRQQVEDPLT